MRRGQLVHSPAGWALIEQLVWVPYEGGAQCFVVVTVEQPDGTDEERPRVFRRDELEPAVVARREARDE
jgi:hypothetical protein